jgi:hypothetical protein
MNFTDQALLSAQKQAEELFAQVAADGLIRAGVLESELSREIYALAARRYGVLRRAPRPPHCSRRRRLPRLRPGL